VHLALVLSAAVLFPAQMITKALFLLALGKGP
jgi:hypothetical protein